MFSKSLIQFSIDGWGCVPSLLLDPRPNHGGVMKIMATSFKRSYARTAALNALDPATTNPRLTKVCLVKAIKTIAFFFPVVMYGCEGWTINKAECRSIDAFELWCWRRVLSPLDCKEIQPVNPKVLNTPIL